MVLLPKNTLGTGSTGVAAGFNAQVVAGAGEYALSIIDTNSCPVTQKFVLSQPQGTPLIPPVIY